jgi:enolase 1/2/3
MKIAKIQAREIFDSRGFPTVACQLFLDDGSYVTSSVPSGMSKGKHEAFELRDGGKRLMGKGVLKAIDSIQTIIAPELIGYQPDVITLDQKMIGLDGTINKERLGANAILAVSIALVKAQAFIAEMEIYELIAQLCQQETVMLPFPLFNMIEGGDHAENNLRIQEFLVIPTGAKNFREAMEYGIELYQKLKRILKQKGKRVCVGDEGGFAPCFDHDIQALEVLSEAIEQSGGTNIFKIGLDIAASQFFDPLLKIYDWNGNQYSTEELIELYKKLVMGFPICYLEDGLYEDDWQGWKQLTDELGQMIQIVGDDLFTTNPERIYEGIQKQVANAVIIKPNQIGTVTETLQAIQLCKDHDLGVIVSHRSGETEDTFIADLAVGVSAGQIKAGGCSRGERLAKYNRLLAIEDQLAFSLLES